MFEWHIQNVYVNGISIRLHAICQHTACNLICLIIPYVLGDCQSAIIKYILHATEELAPIGVDLFFVRAEGLRQFPTAFHPYRAISGHSQPCGQVGSPTLYGNNTIC